MSSKEKRTPRSGDKKHYVSLADQPGNCHVAIVGMSCVFPQAGDIKAFWEMILNKVDAITEVPPERWDWRTYFDPDKKSRDKIYSRWGGFIEPVVFDPMKYGIPPTALKAVDPLQLLSLEVVGRALRDAGLIEKGFDREKTCCVFGTAGGMGDWGLMYAMRSTLPLFLKNIPEELLSQLPEWTEDSFPGILPNVVSGRIANAFDLGGANYTVDAACASGLTAVYNAVRELVTHNANVAIAGAADVMQNPFGFLCFAKTTALTPSGKPKPFDEAADGIVIAEGLGAVVMKRLEDAERDGDKIYAVIRGVGSSSDGRGKSLTAPRTVGQARALNQAYHMAGFGVESVSLIEAHGTGTVVGDSTEAESVSAAMKSAKAPAKSCAVGSVKSQVGHTKGCAGIVGLIKAALALHHKVLPPTINVKKPAAEVFRDEASPVYVNTEPRPWFCGDKPRRAGVNSFGFGGTNFHTILEEHGGSTSAFPLETWPTELFLLDGASAGDIATAAEKLEKALAKQAPRLRDLSAFLWKNRGKGGLRLAIVADSIEDLRKKLSTAAASLKTNPARINDPRGIYFSGAPLRRDGKIAFVFPGQGSQRPDMMRDLTVLFQELQEGFVTADRVLEKRLPKRLSEYIFPPPRFTKEEDDKRMTEITVTNIAQPSLGVTEMGMFKILRALGVAPEMAAGHSSGEYAALCAAGVMPEDILYEVLEDRGSSILNNCKYDLGTMMAVKGNAKDVAALVKEFSGVYVANFNSPTQTIISGLKKDLEVAQKGLEAKGIKCRFIPVSCAFHSPIIEPAREHLAKKLATLTYHPPAFPVYSNVEAQPYPADTQRLLSILSAHLIESVRFVEEIENMYAAGARVFVECGPGNVLSGLVSQILEGKPHVVVATDSKAPRHDIVQLQTALAQLAAEGVEVNLDVFFQRRQVEELDAALKPTRAPEKLSPVSYLVAPDRAWPANQKRPERKLVDLKPDSSQVGRGIPPGRASPTAPQSAPVEHGPASMPQVPAGSTAEVIIRYQQMMQKFMDQQREIMLAFFNGSPAPTQGAVPPAATMPAMPALPKVPQVSIPKPAPAIKVQGTKGTEGTKAAPDAEKTLLSIVAERTGYPNEMLGLDLDIESDLGIDSIKRLEIMIAFAKTIPGAPEDLPEKLNTCRTLKAVLGMVGTAGAGVGTVRRTVHATEPVKSAAKGGAVIDSALPTATDAQGTLLAIVSERTGYPNEMLGLDLDIESDLGIDSIKRLEIMIAFAKTIPGSPEDLPEKLNTCRTLKAVLEMAGTAGAEVGTVRRTVHATEPVKSAAQGGAVIDSALPTDVQGTLLALVSERTGYPNDMLGLDLDIESDLGIDSIKRLEIMIAFAKTIPGAADDLPEKLNTCRTLKAVLEMVGTGVPPVRDNGGAVGIPRPTSAAKAAPDAQQTLLSLVSERTGYPTDMLGLDLDIESDLGIDSIKRLEIMIAFAKTIPGAPDDLPEKLNMCRTLKAVLEMVGTGVAPVRENGGAVGTPRPASTADTRSSTSANGVYRNIIKMEAAPLRAAGPLVCPAGVVLVTDDAGGCAQAVMARIEAAGGKTVLVPAESMATALGAERWISEQREKFGRIGGILHLLPLRSAPDVSSLTIDAWQTQIVEEVKSLFYLLRAAAPDLKASNDAWVLACSSIGRKANNGSLPQPSHPWRGGLMGLMKSVADEWPQGLCKIVDTDNPAPETFVDAIVAELSFKEPATEGGRPDSEFYYRKGERWRPVMKQTPLDTSQAARLQIEKDDVILVFGGARGITADIAVEIAKRHQPTLVMVGRSAWPADESAVTRGARTHAELKKAIFEDFQKQGKKAKPVEVEKACQRVLMDREMAANRVAMESAGARFSYYQADVQDEAGMKHVIETVYREHGRIDGVINGAGIIEDKLIEDKSSDSFDRVFDIKARSVFLLSRLLKPESLKFLVLFSSIAGWIGNRGQADYAAANEVLNRMAMFLSEEWKSRVVAIDWGPWDTVGMASDGVKKQFKERGIGLVPPEAGRRFMLDEISFGQPSQAIVVAEGGVI
jgi:acyl transferase domain-containing protein/NAD(P)-dependent dehydrogenase (short-subunit alcohol dehydrogenase family)/acyl carrier protein